MKNIPVYNTDIKKEQGFSIVAIGAATGGEEAFTELVKHLPHNTGMAYVYIQHMNGDTETNQVEAFKRSSGLAILEAKEATRLLPNHVYVIPPNRKMTIIDGSLKLSLRPVKTKNYLPINDFFSMLADQYREKAIGILLSGNVPDGALGLRSIKEAGGITFAQDSTASFNDMPKHAIAEEVVDLVLSPKRIAEELAKLADQQE